MKDFFAYFFGQGTEVEFTLFTPAHFAPILLMVAVIWWICRNRDSLAKSRHEEKLRYALAFALIICDMSYYWRLVGMPSLQGPCDRSLKSEVPCGSCLNWR